MVTLRENESSECPRRLRYKSRAREVRRRMLWMHSHEARGACVATHTFVFFGKSCEDVEEVIRDPIIYFCPFSYWNQWTHYIQVRVPRCPTERHEYTRPYVNLLAAASGHEALVEEHSPRSGEEHRLGVCPFFWQPQRLLRIKHVRPPTLAQRRLTSDLPGRCFVAIQLERHLERRSVQKHAVHQPVVRVRQIADDAMPVVCAVHPQLVPPAGLRLQP